MDGRGRKRLWQAIAARAETPGDEWWAQAVCEACVEVLGVDAATLALRAGGRAQELLGASDTWAARLAELQYTVGEGPGVDAYTEGGPVLVADVRADQGRWPGFADAAMTNGIGSVFAFPLQVGAIRVGTLELFGRRPGGLPQAAIADAALLAEFATAALLHGAEEAERAGEDYAPRRVTSFQDVNVATGMLAAQLRIGLDDAFARLRAHAFATTRPLREVARDVLERRIPLDELAD